MASSSQDEGEGGGSKEEEEMTKFVHNIFPTLRGAVGQHSGGRGGSNNRLETSPRTSTLSFLLPPFLTPGKSFALRHPSRPSRICGDWAASKETSNDTSPPSSVATEGDKDGKSREFYKYCSLADASHDFSPSVENRIREC